MRLRWECGEEAICPVCRRRNAVLYWRQDDYKCRDCKSQFLEIGPQVKVGETDLGSYGIRPIIEAECVKI